MIKRLIVYNIEYCEGMQGRWWEYLKIWRVFKAPPQIEKNILKELKKFKPDILGLVEVDLGSKRSNNKDTVKDFQKSLHLNNIIEKVKYPLTSWLKLFHHIPILKAQGNALLSKNKFSEIKTHQFSKGTKKVVIQATTHLPKPLTLVIAHLALTKKTRKKQIEELIPIINAIQTPVILMGDFNTFSGISELTPLLEKTKLQDFCKKISPVTEPAFKPSKRLDYILTCNKVDIKQYRTLNFDFSDHLPLLIDFKVH